MPTEHELTRQPLCLLHSIISMFQDQNERPSFAAVHEKLFITCRTKSSPEKIDLSRTKSGDRVSPRTSAPSPTEGSVMYDDVPIEPPALPPYTNKPRPLITQTKLNISAPELSRLNYDRSTYMSTPNVMENTQNDPDNESVYEDLRYENLQSVQAAETVTYTKIITGPTGINSSNTAEPDIYEDTVLEQVSEEHTNENYDNTTYQVIT